MVDPGRKHTLRFFHFSRIHRARGRTTSTFLRLSFLNCQAQWQFLLSSPSPHFTFSICCDMLNLLSVAATLQALFLSLKMFKHHSFVLVININSWAAPENLSLHFPVKAPHLEPKYPIMTFTWQSFLLRTRYILRRWEKKTVQYPVMTWPD